MAATAKKTPAKEVDPFSDFAEFAVDPSEVGSVSAPGVKEDPIIGKRKKLIESCELQIKMFEDPEYKEERIVYKPQEGSERRVGMKEMYRPREQFKQMRDGKWLVTPKYGVKSLFLGGKESYLLDAERVVPLFRKIIEETEKGTLDEKIEELSKRGRKET